MARQLPVTRLSPSLLPTEVGPDVLYSGAVTRALRLARTDQREQVYSINIAVMGDQQVEDFVRLLSTYRRRLDGVGSISVEPWHNSEDGVFVTVHQAQERQK